MSGPSSHSAEHELRALYKRILLAWNQRDAVAMAAEFVPAGNLVGFDGSQVDSRAAIVDHLAPIFADHPTAAYVAKVREVRMLSRDVGLLRAVAGMVPPGGEDIQPALNTVQSLIGVHDTSGDWRAALFQSTPAAWHGRSNDTLALTEELRGIFRRGLIVQD